MRVAIVCALALIWACGSDVTIPGNAGAGGATPSANSSSSASGGSTSEGGSTSSGPTEPSCPSATNISGECDLVVDDCPGSTHCTLVTEGGSLETKCAVTTGTTPAAEKCATSAECVAPGLCVQARCTRFCCPDTNAPCGGGVCDVHVNFADFDAFALVCHYEIHCSLFDDSAPCPILQGCYVVANRPECKEQSAPSKPGACEYVNECESGQFCLKTDGPGTCHFNCDVPTWLSKLPGEGGCPMGETCQPYPKLRDIGACMP